MSLLPTVFLNHGGGPLPLLRDPSHAGMIKEFSPGSLLHSTIHDPSVKAILVISAHHECSSSDNSVELVTGKPGKGGSGSSDSPGLLFDYYGFPPESYKYEFPNPAFPVELVQKVRDCLERGGEKQKFRVKTTDGKRGFDHGVFVPLLLCKVSENIPVSQVSLAVDASGKMDAGKHVELGRCLARLRGEGILLVGSGMSFHNMGVLMGALGGGRSSPGVAVSRDFATELEKLVADEDEAALARWEQLPGARQAHPREEHLIPLMVVRGAGGRGAAVNAIRGELGGIRYVHFVVGLGAAGS